MIESSPSTGNLVQGNFIGTDVTGTSPLGNANHGVIIQVGASANMIGGTAAGSGNVIAFNTGDGVTVVSGTGNAILSNAIFANGGLGIDLGADGVTPNDSLGHNGPNNYQNFPILTSVVTSGGTTTLSGTLNSTPNATFTVQFFANAAPDPSGFGEGQQYLGQTRVTTDGSGNASFSVTLSTPPLVGQFFTATATDDPAGNTSEFSQDISSGTTVTNTNDSGPGSLRQAILNANANPGLDTIDFAPGLSGTIVLTSGELQITDDVTIDGPGANRLIVSGNNASRVFEVDLVHAAISGLTITGGLATAGGGIYNNGGTVTIDASTISGNFVSNGYGGAIYNSGTVTIDASTISDNSAGSTSTTMAAASTTAPAYVDDQPQYALAQLRKPAHRKRLGRRSRERRRHGNDRRQHDLRQHERLGWRCRQFRTRHVDDYRQHDLRQLRRKWGWRGEQRPDYDY